MEHFGIAKILSKSTFSRILSIAKGSKIANATIDVMKETAAEFGEILAVDGKAICATAEKGKPLPPVLHIFHVIHGT
ncbi:hypothetical protein FACS189449_13670 [Alphaproteobacteria bacterium]|nr:hypothetical protein FACS189449_13670 [Alphaproteobacteria bacterium]